ncbi:MAG TPA: aspartate kinase, partial [Bacteroidales bacterium]|nr:aspartate kinase [Bacteroidales bacterium]
MIVYKFGGASVRDAAGIRNLGDLVMKEKERLVVVVSAFGKTTNGLEEVLRQWHRGDTSYREKIGALSGYHNSVITDLFGSGSEAADSVNTSVTELVVRLENTARGDYDHDYDMIVSMGEIWSTIVVEAWLRSQGLNTRWWDIRKLLVTDGRHRDAGIDLEESQQRIMLAYGSSDANVCVTQGFIGATAGGEVTTLGREGSDYTAALIANMLDAEKVVVWKDVPGIMSADPRWLSTAETLSNISYNEAVEMTFSGAKVIHPNTIKPLHNKKIPMHVRSFIDHDAPGTVISEEGTPG